MSISSLLGLRGNGFPGIPVRAAGVPHQPTYAAAFARFFGFLREIFRAVFRAAPHECLEPRSNDRIFVAGLFETLHGAFGSDRDDLRMIPRLRKSQKTFVVM